jgi:hypothetical protein
MAKSLWKKDASTQLLELDAGGAHVFSLAPFEVLTLEATPLAH